MKALLLFLISTDLLAMPLYRIDTGKIEEFTPYSHKYELIISDNCAHCLHQISILQSCVEPNDVAVVMENKSKLPEEKLKRVLVKKKISYKTYLLDSKISESYQFKGITPAMWISKDNKREFFTGVVSCEKLKLDL